MSTKHLVQLVIVMSTKASPLTEYEMLMYEQLCRLLECALKKAREQEELNENTGNY